MPRGSLVCENPVLLKRSHIIIESWSEKDVAGQPLRWLCSRPSKNFTTHPFAELRVTLLQQFTASLLVARRAVCGELPVLVRHVRRESPVPGQLFQVRAVSDHAVLGELKRET